MQNNFKITNNVVLSNNIILLYSTKINVRQQKLFRIAVSCIDTLHPPKDNTVYLSKKDLWKFLKYQSKDMRHNVLREDTIALKKMTVYRASETEAKKRGKKHEVFSVFKKFEWTDYEDYIKIQFDEDALPFLIVCKKFIQYQIGEIANIKKQYTLRLFEILLASRYETTYSPMRDEVHNGFIVQYKPKELRELTDTINSYPLFHDWFKRVVQDSIIEINSKTSYSVKCTKLMTGKSVSMLKFYIRYKHEGGLHYISYDDYRTTW